MQDSPLIFDVDNESFQSLVLDASQQTPVAVDFWAEWCGPCRSLAPILEKVIREFNGGVKLAKLDTDKNRELASAQGIRGLPTVRLFKNGSAVDEFSGAYPEAHIRDFLSPHVQRPSDDARTAAGELRTANQFEEAVELLRHASATDPQNHRLVLDLADTLFSMGSYDDAASTLATLPASEKKSPEATRLHTLLEFAYLASGALSSEDSATTIEHGGQDLDVRLRRSAKNVLEQNYEAAMNELLAILRIDRKYRDNAAHKALLSLFELLGGNHPLVARYRSLLATALH
ncbi:MAG TPA: thioredoxin [Gammaproteobacteria bacterium]